MQPKIAPHWERPAPAVACSAASWTSRKRTKGSMRRSPSCCVCQLAALPRPLQAQRSRLRLHEWQGASSRPPSPPPSRRGRPKQRASDGASSLIRCDPNYLTRQHTERFRAGCAGMHALPRSIASRCTPPSLSSASTESQAVHRCRRHGSNAAESRD